MLLVLWLTTPHFEASCLVYSKYKIPRHFLNLFYSIFYSVTYRNHPFTQDFSQRETNKICFLLLFLGGLGSIYPK